MLTCLLRYPKLINIDKVLSFSISLRRRAEDVEAAPHKADIRAPVSCYVLVSINNAKDRVKLMVSILELNFLDLITKYETMKTPIENDQNSKKCIHWKWNKENYNSGPIFTGSLLNLHMHDRCKICISENVRQL